MRTFQLNFVGDVMLGRLVDQLFPQHVDNPGEARIVSSFLGTYPQLRQYNHRTPWGSTLPLFHSADLNLINLETAVTTQSTLWPHKAFNYRMHPANAAALREANIDYATLANNHTLDFGTDGLVETVWTLRNARIAFAGAGERTDEATRPAVLSLPRIPRPPPRADGAEGRRDPGSLAIHVFAASDHPRDWAVVPTFHLIDYSLQSRSRLKHLLTTPAVLTARNDNNRPPALKVFSVHWGPNYAWHPDRAIRSLAHFLIDECGVDLIHGHSSHHVQGVEIYRGKLIIYGCGDFIDDYALDAEYRNDLGAVWRVHVKEKELTTEKKGERQGGQETRTVLGVERLEIFPTRIEKFQVNVLPREDVDHAWVRETVTRLSRELGTTTVREELGEQGQVVVDVGDV